MIKKNDKLISYSQFRMLFITIVEKEYNKVQRKIERTKIRKAKNREYLNRLEKLMNELKTGKIKDQDLEKNKRAFDKLRNDHYLHYWVIGILSIVVFLIFITTLLNFLFANR